MVQELAARVDALTRLLERSAEGNCIGEEVSQLDHALQSAQLARAAGAAEHEVLAALLHDVGHLCAPAGDPRMGELGVLRHEDVGADYLAGLGFSEDVTELVRGHVAAKRYLVAARTDYAARLSGASRVTLEQQGGPMSEAERHAFEADPRRAAKLRLRSWDEQAKVADCAVDELEAYRKPLHSHLRQAGASRPRSG